MMVKLSMYKIDTVASNMKKTKNSCGCLDAAW